MARSFRLVRALLVVLWAVSCTQRQGEEPRQDAAKKVGTSEAAGGRTAEASRKEKDSTESSGACELADGTPCPPPQQFTPPPPPGGPPPPPAAAAVVLERAPGSPSPPPGTLTSFGRVVVVDEPPGEPFAGAIEDGQAAAAAAAEAAGVYDEPGGMAQPGVPPTIGVPVQVPMPVLPTPAPIL